MHLTIRPKRTQRHALALGLLALASCAQDDPEPVTQVVVTVSGDADALQQLDRIEARIYRNEAVFEPQPVATHVFKLPAAMPLSFGVVYSDARRFLLVLEGFGPEVDGEKALIERKVVAEFTDARSMQLDVQLVRECLRLPSPCRDLTDTCNADARACDGVRRVTMRETEAGEVLPPEASMREPISEACRHSACPAEYPCTPTIGGGHVCLGQFADWPMPDATPGALHPPRYDVSTDGIVRDEVTGLLWQRQVPDTFEGCTGRSPYTSEAYASGCTWNEAKLYCHNLTLGGLKWRLPSRIELVSLIDPGVVPAIAAETFSGCEQGFSWTSTLDAFSKTQETRDAWMVSNKYGSTGHLTVSTQLFCARCVSGVPSTAGSPEARYLLESDQTIRDAFTGLRWQRTLSPPLATVVEAEAYCSALGSEFRLPMLKELMTLSDPTRYSPATDPIFADPGPTRGWVAAASATANTVIDFFSGSETDIEEDARIFNDDDALPRARCVR